MATMQTTLDRSQVKLLEATNVIHQIAELSSLLAASAADGSMAASDETSVLWEGNVELFAAKRRLMEQGLELQHLQEKEAAGVLEQAAILAKLKAAKESLQEKEVDLEVSRAALASRDHELQQLLRRWEQREEELARMRVQVVEEAQHVQSLRQRMTPASSEADKGLIAVGDREVTQAREESAVSEEEFILQNLELEVAKVEVETALSALRGLADLSRELKAECGQAAAVPALAYHNFPSSVAADGAAAGSREKDLLHSAAASVLANDDDEAMEDGTTPQPATAGKRWTALDVCVNGRASSSLAIAPSSVEKPFSPPPHPSSVSISAKEGGEQTAFSQQTEPSVPLASSSLSSFAPASSSLPPYAPSSAKGSISAVTVMSELKELQMLQAQLNEKDVALELARGAMDSLTRLTQKLVSEAGLDMAEFATELQQ
eukprot:TRINITY_DN11351_c0_g1_i3.p1 TRINITY_DN11351_c0_g1~~TRINITY_DN11351_c0_g1_i3.p1  ORF type:complete len:504 (-),score=226.84 TRINITY_DN11351_c0_g1_i3:111-1409(-)